MCGKGTGKCRCGGVSGAQIKQAAAPQLKAAAQGTSPKLNVPQVLPCGAKPAAPPKPKTYSITGVVRDHVGAPLAGAAVTFQGQPAQPPATGPDGVYRFAALPENAAGDVTVTHGNRGFVPARHAVPPLQADLAALNFQQATFSIDCRLAARGVDLPGPHFSKLLEAAEFVLSGDQDEVKPGGATGSCLFGPLPSGGAFQVAARLGDVALGAAQPIASLTQARQLTFDVEVCRVYGAVEKLLPAELPGCSVELRGGAALAKLDLVDQPNFEFPCVPKGFPYTVAARKPGFTIPEKTIPSLSGDTERKLAARVFTLGGKVTAAGQGLGQVDIQVAGLRNLAGVVATSADGTYSVELPIAAAPYVVTPVKVDCAFEPASRNAITDKAASADFKQATYNVEVTIAGGDVATNSYLNAGAGTPGSGSTRRTELKVKLSSRAKAQNPKVGPNSCVFPTVLKGAALTVTLHQPPGCLACPPVAVGDDGKATLIVTLQTFTIGGTVQRWNGQTGVTSAYTPLNVALRAGGATLQTVPTGPAGAYTFAPVSGGANYEVAPVPVPDTPAITFQPTGAVNTTGYRTHEITELDANIPNCDFMAMRCLLSGGAPNAETADFYVNPNQKAVLSNEMVRNLRGERGASHRVRLDYLREAIVHALGNAGQATEAAWKRLYQVNLHDGRQLTLVFGNKTVPAAANDFVGNVVTAYHP